MSPTSASGEARLALGAGLAAYIIWGVIPLAMQAAGHMGVPPMEILAERTVWAVPAAFAFVLLARQLPQIAIVMRQPRILMWLAVSALLIGVNWAVFIWAVNVGRVLETSLGYYINPLLNMAAGALLFRERIDGPGRIAIGLAAVGVAIQAFALGHLPVVSLTLATTFCAYGIVRKRVAADAQTGLMIECLILAVPAAIYIAWLQRTGQGNVLGRPAALGLMVFCGAMTAAPLMLFAWAARRAPLSAMGFMLFLTPTITFVIGVLQGEPFTPARAVSFVFIWGGVAVFAYGAVRRARRAALAAAEARGA